jgi:hypothetical protein
MPNLSFRSAADLERFLSQRMTKQSACNKSPMLWHVLFQRKPNMAGQSAFALLKKVEDKVDLDTTIMLTPKPNDISTVGAIGFTMPRSEQEGVVHHEPSEPMLINPQSTRWLDQAGLVQPELVARARRLESHGPASVRLVAWDFKAKTKPMGRPSEYRAVGLCEGNGFGQHDLRSVVVYPKRGPLRDAEWIKPREAPPMAPLLAATPPRRWRRFHAQDSRT